MSNVLELCAAAKEKCGYIGAKTTSEKNQMLRLIADALRDNSASIIAANATDLAENAAKPAHFLDRLALNVKRIDDMAYGLEQLIALPDPIGEVLEEWTAAGGFKIQKTRVPLGVIAIIYEARPNVTADAIGLCLKTGNSVVLRGSKDAIHSNRAIVEAAKSALSQNGFDPGFVQLITDTTREGAAELMRCREFVDVLIPRGSAGLIRSVVEQSSVAVIETGAGNCHAYVDASADFDMAERIILNGKLQRPSVCNALESLLVDRTAAQAFLPRIVKALSEKGVEVVGCTETVAICPDVKPATEEDYYTEFLALKISVKVVSGVDEAAKHVNRYGTKHSEVIITQNAESAGFFLNNVDSAAVYWNTSTRFTDGFEFGFGAEMGISTQKLHARGPMGLRELTSVKYKIYGNGEVR
ncbi:MAG: glutamate-5-semialdehyde dehydrogenase [Firmicutes bacterium]|nr:glutamate-5-semialdehyde dehydrogenase [Bacillota bacterium]